MTPHAQAQEFPHHTRAFWALPKLTNGKSASALELTTYDRLSARDCNTELSVLRLFFVVCPCLTSTCRPQKRTCTRGAPASTFLIAQMLTETISFAPAVTGSPSCARSLRNRRPQPRVTVAVEVRTVSALSVTRVSPPQVSMPSGVTQRRSVYSSTTLLCKWPRYIGNAVLV